MATIHNSDLTKELQQGAKIQVADRTPSELAEKVIPVMEVNPKILRRSDQIFRSAATNATSSTLITTPSDKDLYIVSATLSVIKDATATSTSSWLAVTPFGGTGIRLLSIPGLTLTAQNNTISVSFPFPIRIARGTVINVNNSTNVGNVTSDATIVGYYDDKINS